MKLFLKLRIELIAIVLFAFFYSCSDTDKEVNELSTKDYYAKVNNKAVESEIVFTGNLQLDTIVFSNSIESSYVGFYHIKKDTIYFFDEIFNYVFRFTKDGSLIDRHIGRGEGPNEIVRFDYAILDDYDYFFLNGANSVINTFDESFSKTHRFPITNPKERAFKEIFDKPIPEQFDSYEFDYGIPNAFQKWDDDHLSMLINAAHPKFNSYFNSDLFHNFSRVLAIIDKKDGKIKKLFGRRPPLYLEKQNIPNFNHLNYDVIDDKVLFNFWADETIYVIDKKTDKIESSFGIAGKKMKTNYQLTLNYKDAQNNWKYDLDTYGYYNFIKAFPDKNLVFRGYRRGMGSITDGLQVYENKKLIADYNVPKGFELIDYIGDTFYGIDKSKEGEKMLFYTFILE